MVVRVVVRQLVVVPDVHRGVEAVELAQRFVGAVDAVLRAVRAQIGRVDRVGARLGGGRGPTHLVDVVAEEDVEVEVLGGGVGVGAEVAVCVALARREAEPLVRTGIGRHESAGAPDRRDVVPRLPEVPVVRVGLQAADAGLERAVDRSPGRDDRRRHDLAQILVAGHDQPRAGLGPGRRELRPEGDRGGARLAGGDPVEEAALAHVCALAEDGLGPGRRDRGEGGARGGRPNQLPAGRRPHASLALTVERTRTGSPSASSAVTCSV